jgi:hypothetical protein
LRRLLFWLFAVFALGETPLSLNDAAGLSEGRFDAPISGQARMAVNTPETVPPSETLAVELATPGHLPLSPLATESGESPFGTGQQAELRVVSEAALAAAHAQSGLDQSAQLGFDSQAPPAAS